MSEIEYNTLLFEISERLDQQNVLERLLFMCRGKLSPVSERQDSIQDTLSLFKELEDRNCLGVDRVQVLKDLLKGIRQWSLFGKVKKFESTRTEYNGLIEQIILVLDELNDMERLIAICRMAIAEANESNIQDVRSLFKELENNECLGIDCLGLLKEILTKTEQGDLLRDVEGFEARRNREDEFESRKAQVADFMSSVGNRLIGVFTLKTVFKVVAGGITVASTLEVLSRGSSFDQFVSAFDKCVLPAGTSLIQITEGCVCLTVQAENLSSLQTLWSLYKDGTLKARLQDFFVTDEVREELAGGDELEVIVTIDEGEYQKAFSELSSEIKVARESSEEARPLRILRRNSDSNLYCKTLLSEVTGPRQSPVLATRPPINQSGYMDPERLAFVQSYLEKSEDTRSMTTDTSDSGVPGTHETPSEFGVEEISESSYKLHLKDLSTEVTWELKRRLEGDSFALRLFFEAVGLDPGLSRQHGIMENILELFPETSVKLLKEVFEALQLYDLVNLLEVKPRAFRPAFPLKEIRKRSNARNRPMRFYSKAAVLIIDSGTIPTQSNPQSGIGAFFKELDPLSKETRVPMTTLEQLFEILISKFQEIEKRVRGVWLRDIAIGEDTIRLNLEDLQREKKYMQKAFLSAEVNDDSAAEMKLREISEKITEKTKELAKCHEKTQKLNVDKKLEMEKEKKETFEEARKEGEKFKMTLDKLREGEESTLFVVCVDDGFTDDALELIMECLKEKLTDKPKLVVSPSPRRGRYKPIPETLYVQFPPSRKDFFQSTMLAILSKRWQTLDLISMMHEVKRTFYLMSVPKGRIVIDGDFYSTVAGNSTERRILIHDTLSSLPRLQKTKDNS